MLKTVAPAGGGVAGDALSPVAAGDSDHLQRALLEVATALNQGLDRQEVFRRIADQLRRLLPYSDVTIGRADRDARIVTPVFHEGTSGEAMLALRIPFGVGLSGTCAATGKSVIWNGEKDAVKGFSPLQVPGTPVNEIERLLVVPLNGPDGVEGTLTIYRDGPELGPFFEHELHLAELFASQAQVAFRNAELYADASERAKRLAAMNRILRSTSENPSLRLIFAAYSDALRELIPFTTACVVLRNEDGSMVREWSSPSGGEPSPIPTGAGADWVIEQGRGYVVEDLATDTRFGAHRWFQAQGARSLLSAALTARGRTFGAVAIGHALPGSYDVRALALFEEVALQVSAAIDNAMLRAALAHQAFHDSLTGLANRALFSDRVEHALVRSARTGCAVAVLFLDLDDFKVVNDRLGHAAGDQLLVIAGQRIQHCLRPSDTAARLGGDEFAVLLEDVPDAGHAEMVAARVIESLRVPLLLEGKEIRMGASLGITTGGSGDDVHALLRNADVAMYAAKGGGKARYEIFRPGLHAAALDRLELKEELQRAFEERQFLLCYQPIVDLVDGRVTGFEALLRWAHPRRGLVSPLDFVPVAEESGLIVQIGRWALDEACRQARQWRDEHHRLGPISVAVNLSARQFQHPALVAEVASALDEAGLEPDRLVLEITESLLMQDTDDTISTLRELKGLGIRLAIDDFGTGYSSLSYLRRFPVDILKIDGSFVAGIADGVDESALGRAIIQLGQTLRLRTIAEGVETLAQLDALRALGCHFGQGFYFDRPLDAEAAGALLAAQPSAVWAVVHS